MHHIFVLLLLKVCQNSNNDKYKSSDGMDALFDLGIVFGLLGMLIHCIKVGQSGRTLLLIRRDVNVFSMPLMTQPCVSWFCK